MEIIAVVISSIVALIGFLFSFLARMHQKTLDIQFKQLDKDIVTLKANFESEDHDMRARVRELEKHSVQKVDFAQWRAEILDHLNRIEKKIDCQANKIL